MSSSRPRNDTRAGKAFSVKSRKPIPSPAVTAAARPAKRKPAAHSGTAAVDALRDGVPARALRDIRDSLDVASAVAYVCAATLKAQAADRDIEVALCLQRCVGDELFGQIQHINRLLGEEDHA